jgi:hypothetical protein
MKTNVGKFSVNLKLFQAMNSEWLKPMILAT